MNSDALDQQIPQELLEAEIDAEAHDMVAEIRQRRGCIASEVSSVRAPAGEHAEAEEHDDGTTSHVPLPQQRIGPNAPDCCKPLILRRLCVQSLGSGELSNSAADAPARLRCAPLTRPALAWGVACKCGAEPSLSGAYLPEGVDGTSKNGNAL